MSNQQFTQIHYFFRGYFIPSWADDEDEPSFERVVQAFKTSENQDIVKQTIIELDMLIREKLSEEMLKNLVNRKLGARINPQGFGMTYQQWLEKVLAILTE